MVYATLGEVPAKGSAALLDLTPMATVPLHHGVCCHSHVLGGAPMAGHQVHNIGGLACESVSHLVSSP